VKNPFVGLRPFQAGDKDVFFGRDQDVAILQNLILAVPVLVVYAPSGTGKSSLLNAGLLPEVAKDDEYVPIVVAGSQQDVTEVATEALTATGWEPPVVGGLADLLEHHHKDTERRAILVLDQFEERLKHEKELELLYAQLARLANTRSNAATVVISIREDYLAGLAGLMERVSGLLDASYRVAGLTREDLIEAVRGPIATVDEDITIDDGLIEEVLDDLETETRSDAIIRSGRIEAGYFQIVWSRLWEKDIGSGGRRITRETYEAEERAAGILKSFVSSTLDDLLPVEAQVLWAALRYMVLPTGAKVPLTVDDILGLLQFGDFMDWGTNIFNADDYDRYGRRAVDKEQVRPHLQSMLDFLTRTESPLFRRAVRGERTEYELVHDLLGLILLDWRQRFLISTDMNVHRLREQVFGEPVHGVLAPGRASMASAHKNMRSAIDLLTGADREHPNPAPKKSSVEKARGHMRDAIATMVGGGNRLEDDSRTLLATYNARLSQLMLNHPDRRARGAAQISAYEMYALRDLLNRRPDNTAWITNVVVWCLGALAAIGGIVIARFAIDLVWSVPPVQYAPLTFAVIVIGAAFLQCAVYVDEARRDIDLKAARRALWPKSTYSDGELPLAGRIVIAWPVVYLVLAVASYAGAALFGVFDWAPTAGFNLTALIASLVLGVMYFLESDL
jgi:hypothetical protein